MSQLRHLSCILTVLVAQFGTCLEPLSTSSGRTTPRELAAPDLLMAEAISVAQANSRSVGLYNKVYAFCIGINDYPGAPLRWAEKDARDLANLFEERYGFNVQSLLGKDATKNRIRESILDYQARLGPNDALIVFFAGHGQTVPLKQARRGGYLVPYGMGHPLDDTSDPSAWDDQAVSMKELGEIIAEFKARHVLFLVDACYSGFLGRRSLTTGRADLDELLSLPSRMVITAGTEDEEAYESDDLGHGFFTKYLMEELQNSQVIGATELFVGLRNSVARYTNKRMLPQLREIAIENGEFVFVPRDIGNVEAGIQEANVRMRARSTNTTTLEELYQVLSSGGYRYSVRAFELQTEWEEKFNRFEENTKFGDGLAMACLSFCYAFGTGVDKDPSLAYHWAKEAYDTDPPAGAYALSICYDQGVGVGKNELVANELLQLAVKSEFAPAVMARARELLINKPTESEVSVALSMLEKAVGAKYLRAIFYLGFVYCANIITADAGEYPTDVEKASKLLQEASDQGDREASYALALLHDAPIDVFHEANKDTGLKLLLMAAEGGLAEAQYRLCSAFVNGGILGLEKNSASAIKWGELAARQDHMQIHGVLSQAYFNLGEYDEARKQIELGVAKDDTVAVVEKAFAMIRGDLYPKNVAAAVPLLNQAAAKEDGRAQLMLAVLYKAGLAGNMKEDPNDGAKRLYWLVKSAKHGYEEALKHLKDEHGSLRADIASMQRGQLYYGDDILAPPAPTDVFQAFEKLYPAETKVYIELMGGPVSDEIRNAKRKWDELNPIFR